ncbi:Rieske 2Fe-2S domain-containing protein [Flavobacteriaceae bacterium]|nr:Rieske 2Fe-2S domain-containing protein [Flavobacteriaceae bacterium]|tara:strand:+ start:293 stop:808 length:516 start_codon:yes stop_codon:yes gene_type:complete
MKRIYFIKKISSLLGVSITSSLVLNSCEIEDEIIDEEVELTEQELLYNDLKGKTAESGFFLEKKILYIDITNKRYSQLNTVGEFINDSENYVLLLRKTEENILALSNCCPHLGTTNRWSYSNGGFRCANHGNSYGTGTGFVSNCSSNSTSGNLKQYNTELNQDILKVDFND